MMYRVRARLYRKDGTSHVTDITAPVPIDMATDWMMKGKLVRASSGLMRDYWLEPTDDQFGMAR